MDIAAMQKRRASIVRQLTGGIAGLFKANNVEGLVGHGKLLKGKKVEFTPVDGNVEIIGAEHVILASGSMPIELPVARFDGEKIIDSWDTLELEAVRLDPEEDVAQDRDRGRLAAEVHQLALVGARRRRGVDRHDDRGPLLERLRPPHRRQVSRGAWRPFLEVPTRILIIPHFSVSKYFQALPHNSACPLADPTPCCIRQRRRRMCEGA